MLLVSFASFTGSRNFDMEELSLNDFINIKSTSSIQDKLGRHYFFWKDIFKSYVKGLSHDYA